MSEETPIRLLVVNGCSMTYGDELADRLETGWAALLARRLGVPFINLGACAGSNHRLIRLTVERLDRYAREHGLRPEEVLFLGMWSRINRFEVFGGEPDRRGGQPEQRHLDHGWWRIHPQYTKRRDARSIAWYRELQHDTGDKSEFLFQWVMFDAWLASQGYQYGYMWAFDPDPRIFQEFPHFSAQLDLSRVIGSDRLPYGGPSIFSIGQSLDDLGPDRHPLERSQEYFVENHVYDWVRGLLRRPVAAHGYLGAD